ncbi:MULTISPECIES: flavodoxin domain-containing protein [unclassified Mesotoga]|uniref:flavodoxin family protein n=1 Tax=unclassified Mesotoga TaxID=1184398 RepID=UPI000CCC322A|nr:flavodoxin domain-containing protein [Mesotoga sp. B105.6.4]PNS36530.1 flavodoxin/nitric oxide synthase [Mesotoga sp. B105.6.4]
MKIGIIAYSKTGNTLYVAEKLRDELISAGKEASVVRLRSETPDLERYEGLVFCTPVNGGAPADTMKSYLAKMKSLEGKKVALMATGLFPAALGRRQTLAYMKKICREKGAEICGEASVGWWSFGRERKIERLVDDLASCFK